MDLQSLAIFWHENQPNNNKIDMRNLRQYSMTADLVKIEECRRV